MKRYSLIWAVGCSLTMILIICTACAKDNGLSPTPKPIAINALNNIANLPPTTKPTLVVTPKINTTTPIIAVTPTRPAPVAVTSPTPIAFSGKGTVLDRKFFSPVLNREMPYRVYLPPSYDSSTQRYPVLYMLHGLSGSYLEWIDYKLLDIADTLINQGMIQPMIIMLPSGDQEYWVDHANNGPQYGYYVVHDVVAHLDATYRTLANRENRAIGGHSMGGHGALQLAFNYPDVFSVVGAHSPTLRTKSQAPDYFGDTIFYAAHDPVSLAYNAPNLNSLKIWLDIGTQDLEWRPRVEELHQVLTDRSISQEWHLFEGDHGGEYWLEHVPDYLQFYSSGLSGN